MASPIDELLNLPGDSGDAVRNAVATAPLPGEMPADTDRRVATQQAIESQAAEMQNRQAKADLTQRDIPFFTDDTGKVKPVTDPTGAALTGLDKTHHIAYDSGGNAQRIQYGEFGPPKLVDPFATTPVTTDPTTGDQYQKEAGLAWKWVGRDPAVAAQRFKGKDLAQRAIPTYMDENGVAQPVTDATGAPLTNFDKPNNVAYDSAGKAVQLKFGLTGPPAVEDAMTGVPVTTDPKTGFQYKIRRGLPWENVGVDPEIQAKNLEAEKQAAVTKAAKDAGQLLSIDQRQNVRDEVDFKAHKKELIGLVPTLADHQGTGEDPAALSKVIDDYYNSKDKYGSDEANKKGGVLGYGSDYTPQAQALRTSIDAEKARAHQLLDNVTTIGATIKARQAHIEQTQAQLDAASRIKLDADLARATAAGVPIPGGAVAPATPPAPSPAPPAATPPPPTPSPTPPGFPSSEDQQKLFSTARAVIDGMGSGIGGALPPGGIAAPPTQQFGPPASMAPEKRVPAPSENEPTSAGGVTPPDPNAPKMYGIDRGKDSYSFKVLPGQDPDKAVEQAMNDGQISAKDAENFKGQFNSSENEPTSPGGWARDVPLDKDRSAPPLYKVKGDGTFSVNRGADPVEAVNQAEARKEITGQSADYLRGQFSSSEHEDVTNANRGDPDKEMISAAGPAADEALGKVHMDEIYGSHQMSFADHVYNDLSRFAGEAASGVGKMIDSPFGRAMIAGAKSGDFQALNMKDVEANEAEAKTVAKQSASGLDKLAGVITEPAWKEDGQGKAFAFAGGIAPWVVQGAVAPELTIPMLFSVGYQGQHDAAHQHLDGNGPADKAKAAGQEITPELKSQQAQYEAEVEATAQKSGAIGGAVNSVLGIPFKSAGKVIARFFGAASTPAVEQAFREAYEKGGSPAVAKLLTAWKEAFDASGPGLVPAGGQAAAHAAKEDAFRAAASKGMMSVIDQLNKTVAQRAGIVMLNAGRDAAIFGGTTAGQNLIAQQEYNPDQKISEGVMESAKGGFFVGALFGALGEKQSADRAKSDRKAFADRTAMYDEATGEKKVAGRVIPPSEESGGAATPPKGPEPTPPVPVSPTPEPPVTGGGKGGGKGGSPTKPPVPKGPESQPPAPPVEPGAAQPPAAGETLPGGQPPAPTGTGPAKTPPPPSAPAAGGSAAPTPSGPVAPAAGGSVGDVSSDGDTTSTNGPATVDTGAHDAATSPKNDLSATQAQLEANNAKLGHANVAGMDISIEHPEGSTRYKVDEERLQQVADKLEGTHPAAAQAIGWALDKIRAGNPEAGFENLRNVQRNTYAQHPDLSNVIGEVMDKAWSRKMAAHYGYIKGTESGDGEHLDTYVKPGTPEDYKGPVYVVNSHVEPNGRVDHKAVIGAASLAEAKQIHDAHYPEALHADPKDIATFSSPETFKAWAMEKARRGPAKGDVTSEDAKAKAKREARNKEAVEKLRDKISEAQAEIDYLEEEGQGVPDGQRANLKKLQDQLKALTDENKTTPEETPVPEEDESQGKGGDGGTGKKGKTQPGNGGPLSPRPERPAAGSSADYSDPETAGPIIQAALDRHAGRFAALGVTVRPHTSADPKMNGGIAINPHTLEVLHDTKAMGDLMKVVKDKGGDAEKWMEHSIDEEHEHALGMSRRGHEFDRFMANLIESGLVPKDIRDLLERVYPDDLKPAAQGAELMRMMGQIVSRGAITESFIPGRPAAELIEAISKWDAPKEVTDFLEEVNALRDKSDGKAQAPTIPDTFEGRQALAEKWLNNLSAGDLKAEMEKYGVPHPRAQKTWDKARNKKPDDTKDYGEDFMIDAGDDLTAWARAAKKTVPAPLPAPPSPTGKESPSLSLARKVSQALAAGPLDRRALTEMAKGSGLSQKQVDEAAELGVVLTAREVVAQGGDTFGKLVDLYNSQPNLSAKTSTSKINQAYSTPVPLAWATGKRIGMADAKVAADDTAGNGALTLAAKPENTIVNEIDPQRAENLQQLGFKQVTRNDATAITSQADRKNLNPPFGTQLEGGAKKEWPLYTSDTGMEVDTPNIDMAIVAKSLSGLTADGKASIIMGGKMGNADERAAGYAVRDTQLPFWHWLYKNFNVTDHFTVAGDLYAKQGARWPVDVIIVEGKGESTLPKPWMTAPPVLDSWQQVGDRLLSHENTVSKPGQPDSKPPVQRPAGGKGPGAPGLGGSGSGKSKPPRVQNPRGGGGNPPAVPPGPTGPAERPGTPPAGGKPAGGVKAGGGVQPPKSNAPDKLSAAEQAAKDAAGDLFGASNPSKALVKSSSPEERNYDTPIPPERMGAMLPAFMNLAKEADTPEKFAAAVARLGPKAPNYIQALWFGAKMGGAQGPDRPNWGEIYGAKKEPEKKDEAPPEHKLETDKIVDVENPFQANYTPRSKAALLNATLVPVNLRDEINKALDDLEARRGNIDEFATSQARWLTGGMKELHSIMDGGQIDAFALAIDKIMNGTALITGDQTGMGKGRVAAAIMTWAQQEGHIPVFITAGDNLYLPMIEDLKDIHADHMVPFLTNTDTPLKNDEGDLVMSGVAAKKQKALLQGIIDNGRLPVGKNVIFSTYDQIGKDRPSKYSEPKNEKRGRQARREPVPDGLRTQMLRAIAPRAVFIMDESHLAAGNSDVGFRLMQMLMGWDRLNRIGQAQKPVGAYYSSATFAKRADNMPIYAVTDLGKAVPDPRTLSTIFERGGVAMQQVVSAMLARAGQYVRREMSFDGVNFINHLVGEAASAANPNPEQYRQADAFTAPLRDIVNFSQHVQTILEAINRELRADGVMINGRIQSEELSGVNFADQIHSMVSQYLLAVKAKATGEEAVKHLAAGRKPVITVENTLAGPYSDVLDLGFEPNFVGLLHRYLHNALEVTRKKPDGTTTDEHIHLEQYMQSPNPRIRQLAAELKDEFDTLTDNNNAANIRDLHISPIDTIKEAIEAAGYTMGEITGRPIGVKTDGTVYKRSDAERTAAGKNDTLSKFVNAGRNSQQGYDAMTINKSGSTGISAHAAEKFYDKRPRVMLIAQPNADISIMMQMYGRIFRKGQISLPEYYHLLSQIAGERRLASVLARKLKSLKANTTSNTTGAESTDSADLFNNYGDIASYTALETHPEIVRMLVHTLQGQLPARFDQDGKDLIQRNGGFYAKVSGETNVLPAKWQDTFYNEAGEEWRAIVAEADEMGNNELKVDAMDLKARTMDSEILAPEVGDTEFESAAHLETVETKAGRDPIPHAEVMKTLAENTEPAKESVKNWGLDFDIARTERMADLQEKQGNLPIWPQIQQQADSRMNRDKGVIADAFRMMGRGVTVDMGDGVIATGVVTNVKPDAENPMLPSRQKVVVHINTSKRTITLPASQARRRMTETSLEEAALRYDSTVNRSTRRHIVTGNLIAGWDALKNQNAEGKIITFTKEDGTVSTGILLPVNYNPGAAMAKVKTLEQLTRALASAYEVRTPSGLSIRNVGGMVNAQTCEVRAPAARNRGGRYWREADFNRLLTGGEMRQKGSDMVGTIATSRLGDLLNFVNTVTKEQLSYTIPPRTQGASSPLRGASNPRKSLKETIIEKTPGLEGLSSLLTPSMKSQAHLNAAITLRGALGPMNKTQEEWNDKLEPGWWHFEKLGVKREGLPIDQNPGLKFMSDRSTGAAMPTPEMQAINNQFYTMEARLLGELKAAGAEMQDVRENYQKGAWTPESRRAFNAAMQEAQDTGLIPRDYDVNTGTPAQRMAVKTLTDKYLAEGKGGDENAIAYLARRPLKGGESFRKGKVFQDDWIHAVEHGLVSFSNNPVEVEKLLLAEMSRSIMGNQALREFEKSGDITTAEGLFHPPNDSYVKLADKYGEMWGGSNVPVWKVMRELAKSAKKDLYFADFGKDIFADPALKQEVNDMEWQTPTGPINIHGMHTGTGRSYSQLVIEKLLEDHDAFEQQFPATYAKLEGLANSRPKLQQILDTPTFADLEQRLPVGGRVLKGYRYARKPVADVLNNYLSSSLYNNKYFGTLYKGWMGFAAALNQTQLGAGLSFFHAAFVTAEAQITGIANALQDVYGVARGNRSFKQLGNTLRTSAAATWETPMTGDEVLNAWRDPDGVINPRIAQVVEALKLSGAGFTMERGMQTDQFHKAVSDVLNGKRLKALGRSPVAAMEVMSHWIMQGLVPRQKAGVFAHMVWRIIEQNPGTDLKTLAPQFNRAWNDVDARLGQVRYDRLFIHNVAKNVLQGTIRAAGWSGGTLNQILGALKDTYAFFDEWTRSGKPPQDLPPRVAYTMGLLILSATVCGALTYLFTGEHPHGMDFWAFRTGGTDEHGNPERMVIPTYTKDLFAYSQDTTGTLINKLHPALALMHDQWVNKDYYGTQITNEDDGKLKKLYDRGKYVVKAFEPFWSRGLRREHDRGGGFVKMAAPMIGVTAAPKSMTQTAAEKKAGEFAATHYEVGGRTQAQADKSAAVSKLVEQLRRRQTPDYDPAIKAGYITTDDIPDLRQKASITPLQSEVKRLPIDQAEAVYRLANPKEKAQLTPMMVTKRQNALDKKLEVHTGRGDSTMFGGF